MRSSQDEPIVGFAVLTGLFLSFLMTKVMLQMLGKVVVAEMWSPIEMRELVVMIELWFPIEMQKLGEVVMIELWSPIEM